MTAILIVSYIFAIAWFAVPMLVLSTGATQLAMVFGVAWTLWYLYHFFAPKNSDVKTFSLEEIVSSVEGTFAKHHFRTNFKRSALEVARAIMFSTTISIPFWSVCLVLTLLRTDTLNVLPWTYLGYAALVAASIRLIHSIYQYVLLEKGLVITVGGQRLWAYVLGRISVLTTCVYFGAAAVLWVLQ